MRDMTPEEIFSQLDAINLRPLDAVDSVSYTHLTLPTIYSV